MTKTRRRVLQTLAAGAVPALAAARFPDVPADYLKQPETIPDFWISTVDGVMEFLDRDVRKGEVRTIGRTAGGRPMRAVFHGSPRRGEGTTTFSGSVGCRDVRAYLGPDHEKKVFLAMGSVHGAEFEGIVGLINLIAVLEKGSDLRGKRWPEIVEAAGALDRVILIPIANADGRARVPIRMEITRGRDDTVHEYLNTGGQLDGSNIGWPQCKRHIPMDFSKVQFPGGYPNDAGVNIQHDDFFSKSRQPETQALFDLAAEERPDLVLNMHTGVGQNNYFMRMHRPFCEPALEPVFDGLYRAVHGKLARNGLQGTTDPATEGDASRAPGGKVYNIDTALNLHCGALSTTIESPSHGFTGTNRAGEEANQTPEKLLDAQLTAHLAAMEYLAAEGGRSKWAR